MVAADLYLSDRTETVLRTVEDFTLTTCLAVPVSPLGETGESICVFARTMTAPLASRTHLAGTIIEFV